MTGKEFLKEYKRLERQVDQLGKEIQELRNQALVHADHASDFIPHIVDKEKALADLIGQKVDRQMVIFRGICLIADFLQEEVMLARYIQGLKWSEIADELEISIHYCYALHKKALCAFDRLFEGKRKDGENLAETRKPPY